VDTGRHTVVFDLPNAKMVFMTGGVTNSYGYSDGGADKTVDAGVSFAGEESTMPLSLFGRWSNAQATTFANMARVRIYGVKIYEGDVLVRDFVPCLKDGVACFKDLKNGGFIIGENAAAFTAGGDVQTFADDFIFERACIFELLPHNGRTEVSENLHAATETEKGFLRAELRSKVIPFWAAHSTEQGCVRIQSNLKLLFWKGMTELVDG
jgi:hypothetical protein